MTCINMTRIHLNRNTALHTTETARGSVAWGKRVKEIVTANAGTIHALVFSAVLIVCSLTVGCSSDQPKPVSNNNQIPVAPAQSPLAAMPAPAMRAEAKPAPKKVVPRKPATVNYTDKAYGVTFEYPRRYAIETGDAAAELLLSSPVPMNFVEPGGVALAAVELPETGFANTDFSSAYFNVSVHKTLTADQCNEFAVPQPRNAALAATNTDATKTDVKKTEVKIAEVKTADETVQSTPVTTNVAEAKPAPSSSTSETQTAQSTPAIDNATPVSSPATSESTQTIASQPVTAGNEATGSVQPQAGKSEPGNSGQPAVAQASNDPTPSATPAAEPPASKLLADLMLKDNGLRATEAVSGEGTRQSDSKYFHVYQNGACYEFALNVTTVASEDHMTRHVDRDKVFSKLEKIMTTVKIDAVNSAPEVTAEKPVTAAPTPAQ